MSASDTDLEKQKRHHRFPLLGMGLAVGIAVLLFAGWLVWLAYEGETPREATPEIPPAAPGASATE